MRKWREEISNVNDFSDDKDDDSYFDDTKS